MIPELYAEIFYVLAISNESLSFLAYFLLLSCLSLCLASLMIYTVVKRVSILTNKKILTCYCSELCILTKIVMCLLRLDWN